MAVPTPNWGFDIPTVGGDNEVWGGLLNGNWSSLDTILATDAAAVFLPVAGGIVTGTITFDAIPQTNVVPAAPDDLINKAALDSALGAIPGSPVTTVFGRSGAVLAIEADYSGFFPLISDLNATDASLLSHMNSVSNPHSVNATQAGAVALANKATQPEAEAGADNNAWMTPLRTKEAITAQVPVVTGALEFIYELLVPSDTPQVDIIDLAEYVEMYLVFNDAGSGASSQLEIRTSIDNGANYAETNGDYYTGEINASSRPDTGVPFTIAQNDLFDGFVDIKTFNKANAKTVMASMATRSGNGGARANVGNRTVKEVNNAIRITSIAANVVAGTYFALYGVKG